MPSHSDAVQDAAGDAVPATLRPLMALCGISKSFPGVRALDDVSFSIHAGEVHMLMGENGAGKSTLMKILCGAYTADAGHFMADGRPVEIRGTSDAARLGVAVIFQEFSLVPHLSVAQNIFLGREPRSRWPGLVDLEAMNQQASTLLASVGLELDPRTAVHQLGVAQQQMVEIAKALSQKARILVMDEPTAALSERETARLFAVIRRLKADGVAIVYISHRMAEVFAMGDRVTVLRDGRMVRSVMKGEATPSQLVAWMVGREVDMTYARQFTPPGETLLRTRGLAAESGVHGIDLEVRAGEIVGLAGLVGAGRTEVARAIFGADRVTAGEVLLFGQPFSATPERARRAGLALVPESRKTQGVALTRTVGENLVLASLSTLFPRVLYSPARAAEAAKALIERLRIATPTPHKPVQQLSGGNQQKVAIGKWLQAGSRLLIVDEPTRGVDVGAKAEIFALLDGLVRDGAAVLMISSELPEIVHVCDRVYVMREMSIAGELSRHELTEERVMHLAVGDERAAA